MRCLLVVVALVAWVGTPAASASADDAVWALLKGGGQVVMIRHAKTDGSTVSLWAPFTPDLLSGFFRLQVIILGENGIVAISQPFQFRYCNPACTPD